jgi:hypothetical protein
VDNHNHTLAVADSRMQVVVAVVDTHNPVAAVVDSQLLHMTLNHFLFISLIMLRLIVRI